MDNSGNMLARYTQGLNIDEPVAQVRSGTTSYYEADGLGSITSLTDSSTALAGTYNYDTFGNLSASPGSLTNPFRYTAREFDQETGLYYYRARYYDPSNGRFLNEDPLGFSGDGPNLYPYVANDPANWFDLTGEGKEADRGRTARPGGTDNPFKKLKPDPDDPNKVIWKDKDGKDHKGPKPQGFDDYWNKKHPQQCQQPKKEEPKKMENSEPDYYCKPGERFDCVPRPDPRWFPGFPINPVIPGMPTVPVIAPEPVFVPL